VQESVPVIRPSQQDRLPSCLAADALALKAWKHGPPDLEDLIFAPGQLPIPDPTDRCAARFIDDLELPESSRS
jgi:hypothetical protein